jgi:hypothetical protein
LCLNTIIFSNCLINIGGLTVDPAWLFGQNSINR